MSDKYQELVEDFEIILEAMDEIINDTEDELIFGERSSSFKEYISGRLDAYKMVTNFIRDKLDKHTKKSAH